MKDAAPPLTAPEASAESPPGSRTPLLSTREIWYTRDMAQNEIDSMIPTRPLKARNIRQWAIDMREGRWRRNGETVKRMRVVQPDGSVTYHMFDGQNRMHAFLLSGLDGVWFNVADGAEDGSVKTVDIGTARSLGDMLAVDRQLPNSKFIASVVTRLWFWDVMGETMSRRSMGANHLLLDQYFEDHQDEILTGVTFSGDAEAGLAKYPEGAIKSLMTLNAFAVTRIILRRLDPAAAEDFLSKLVNGGSDDNGVIARLRVRLAKDRSIDMRYKDTSNATTWPFNEIARALVFRVWNNIHTPRAKPLTMIQVPDVRNHYPYPVVPGGKKGQAGHG
jgi:hypothetical protein